MLFGTKQSKKGCKKSSPQPLSEGEGLSVVFFSAVSPFAALRNGDAAGDMCGEGIICLASPPLPSPKGEIRAKQPGYRGQAGVKGKVLYLALFSPLGDGRGYSAEKGGF